MHADIVGLADGEIAQNQTMGIAGGGIRSSPGIVSCIIARRIASSTWIVAGRIVARFKNGLVLENEVILFLGGI